MSEHVERARSSQLFGLPAGTSRRGRSHPRCFGTATHGPRRDDPLRRLRAQPVDVDQAEPDRYRTIAGDDQRSDPARPAPRAWAGSRQPGSSPGLTGRSWLVGSRSGWAPDLMMSGRRVWTPCRRASAASERGESGDATSRGRLTSWTCNSDDVNPDETGGSAVIAAMTAVM